MTGRVLIVDDDDFSAALLSARLEEDYYDVEVVRTGAEALDFLTHATVDVILLDVVMPGMDGFEVCRRLKADPATQTIPVVMVTALDQPADRVRGLEAGADDFLTKPFNAIALLTRVKSLVRLKHTLDELELRVGTVREINMRTDRDNMPLPDPRTRADDDPEHVLLIDDDPSSGPMIAKMIPGRIELSADTRDALMLAATGDYDLVIVNLALTTSDGLRLVSQLRTLERTRAVPILVVVSPDEETRLLRALDLGANDYLVRPVDGNELAARVRTQVRRKRYSDRLRFVLQKTIELAVTDPLTGLFNRRYLDRHLPALVSDARRRRTPLAALMIDIDFFKQVNDIYGHDGGDAVLTEMSRRIRASLRGLDLCCRYGGEEFVVVLPDSDAAQAAAVAERLRARITESPFSLGPGRGAVPVTISIGIAALGPEEMTPEGLLKKADLALYEAKRAGRNRVVASAA
ncbi:PleD family two-component system response regulator [Segnochrobactraceae bacterium EtOH-i3]